MASQFAAAETVRAGDVLIADDGFSCLLKGEAVTVKRDDEGELYVPCVEGRHYLDAQLTDGRYVGLMPTLEASLAAGPIFGPWFAIEQDEHWSVHASDPDAPPLGNLICKLPLDEQGAARSRLIGAAPRMLEALREVHVVLAVAEASGDDGVSDVLAVVRSAIDQAQGVQS